MYHVPSSEIFDYMGGKVRNTDKKNLEVIIVDNFTWNSVNELSIK